MTVTMTVRMIAASVVVVFHRTTQAAKMPSGQDGLSSAITKCGKLEILR